MKKIFFLLISSVLVVTSWAQVKSGDAELDRRLSEYMKYNDELNFEKVMDYMHPKLFKIAPKEALISVMKQAFESEEMQITMDDLAVTAVGPAFKSAGTDYRKVDYSMTMTMRFRDTSVYSPEFIETMTETFAASFPEKKVTYNKETKAFIIAGSDILYAIKDAGKPWLFLGYKNDANLIKQLFSKEVIDHFKMLD